MLINSDALVNTATAIGSVSFAISVYFLKEFVQNVRDLSKEVQSLIRRMSSVEQFLSLAPEDIGQYQPPRGKHKRFFRAIDKD